MAFPESGGMPTIALFKKFAREISAHALTHINVMSILYGIVLVSFAASTGISADHPQH
jgi:hypothetical protein